MDALKLLLVIHVLIAVTGAAKLLDSCTLSTDCPQNSTCIERGCDGRMCVCQGNSMPSEDLTTCFQIKEIGEYCGFGERCRGSNSRCDNGTCVCNPDYTRVVLNISNATITYCKPKPAFKSEPLWIGQTCETKHGFCVDGYNSLTCANDICACINGYREATRAEIDAYPFSLVQCVPQGFSLILPLLPTSSQLATSSIVTKPSISTVGTLSVSSMRSPSLDSVGITSESVVIINTVTPSMSSLRSPSLASVGITSESVLIINTVTPSMSSLRSPSLENVEKSSSVSIIPTSLVPSSTSTSSFSSSGTSSSTLNQFMSTSETQFQTNIPISYSSALVGEKTKTFTTPSMPTIETTFTSLITLYSSIPTSRVILVPSSEYSSMTTNFETTTTTTENKVTTVYQTEVYSLAPSVYLSESSVFNSLTSESLMGATSSKKLFTTSDLILESSIKTDFMKSSNVIGNSQPSSQSNKPTPSIDISTETTSTTSILSNSEHSKLTPSSTKTLPNPTSTKSLELSTSKIDSTQSSISTMPLKETTSTSTSTAPNYSESVSGLNRVTTASNTQETTLFRQTGLDGDNCTTSSDCMINGVCEEDQCGRNRCRSKIKFILDNTNKYRQLQKLGEECNDNSTCAGPFTRCQNGVCSCQGDYVKSSDGLWCTYKSSWFIKFPLLGDECSSFFSECFHSLEQTCVSGKCQCKTGLRQAGIKDQLVPSSVYYQCRNESLEVGHRDKRDCMDGPESFPADPYYSRAIKRIRTMQGIIFGTLAGFVAVVCFIIAGICYFRHRNRTMMKDMRSDNGSVVSFDRQSSGKYSFKIPRPFMPMIKDWDTDHLSYTNTAFTTDDSEIPKGSQTLRSHRSIPLPDQTESEGYNRPNDRKISISTTSTVDAEMTSSTGDAEVHSVESSPESVTKSYQANHINLKFEES